MTIEPQPTTDNHHWTTTIGREKKEVREEREEKIEVGENKIFFFFLQSKYNELLLIIAHCSSMLKFIAFSIFIVDVFL